MNEKAKETTKGRYTYEVHENCLILKIPTLLVHLRPKFFHSLNLGRPISNEIAPYPPPPHPPFPLQMITNQLNENIIQGWLLYLIRSFSMMSGHGANSLIKNKDWTSRTLVNPPPLTPDNISFFLYPLPLKVDVMCVSPLM